MKPIRWPVAVAIALLAACTTTRIEPELNFPPPLVARIPAVVGIYMSVRTGLPGRRRQVRAVLGKAQSEFGD
jgi:hypothetical protein